MDMKKRTTARAMLCMLLSFMLVASLPLTSLAYDAVSTPYYSEDGGFLDGLNVKNAKAQGVVEYLYAQYGDGEYHRFKGKGQCYGYAEKIRQLFGTRYSQKKFGVKPTKSNLYKKLKNKKPGTHVRFSMGKGGSGKAHSIALLKITKKKIWYTDANMDWNNGIGIYVEDLSLFSGWARKYKYLAWAREPKGSIPTTSKLSIKALCEGNGPTTGVAWRPVKKAKKYIVYRSPSKKGSYSAIATVKGCYYKDESTDLYGSVYYKVKAVKGKKTISTSKPAHANRCVKSPRVYLTEKDEGGVTVFEMTWKPVHGASKYNIYIDNHNGKDPKKIATVGGTVYKYKPTGGRGLLRLLHHGGGPQGL